MIYQKTADMPAYWRFRRARFKEAGICMRCERAHVKRGRVHCVGCLEAMCKRVKKYITKRYKKKAFREALNERRKRDHAKDRLRCLDAYGGRVCACCGERQILFLTIDHINGHGTKESRKDRRYIYVRLRQQGYPKGYRVLCYNCNCGRARNGGICPHKQKT